LVRREAGLVLPEYRPRLRDHLTAVRLQRCIFQLEGRMVVE